MTIDVLYWIASYIHILAMIGLLLGISYNQHCYGISVKSQLLYALVFTTRYLDLLNSYPLNADAAFKIAYIVPIYCTLLTTLLVRKTYQKNYDTSRIEMLIIPCAVISVLINHDPTIFGIFWTFSIYLEAVAIIPQYQFIIKAKRIKPCVFYYINTLGICQALNTVYWVYQYNYSNGTTCHNIRVAAGLVQLLLYCDFYYLRIVPGLYGSRNKQRQVEVATIQTHVAKGDSKTGHLASNVSTVVLMPDSIAGVHNFKMNFMKGKETIGRY